MGLVLPAISQQVLLFSVVDTNLLGRQMLTEIQSQGFGSLLIRACAAVKTKCLWLSNLETAALHHLERKLWKPLFFGQTRQCILILHLRHPFVDYARYRRFLFISRYSLSDSIYFLIPPHLWFLLASSSIFPHHYFLLPDTVPGPPGLCSSFFSLTPIP
jgi:hypothetical protein